MQVNLPILVAVAVAVILLGGFLFAGEPLWLFLFALYLLVVLIASPWLLVSLAAFVACLWLMVAVMRRGR